QSDQDDRYRPNHQPRQFRAYREGYIRLRHDRRLEPGQSIPTDDFSQVATIPVGNLPHGVWPSGDGSRVYVGLENADALAAIDTATNSVIANIPIGQAPQAIAYVPNAAPNPDDRENLQPLGVAGQVAHLALAPK